MDIWTELALIPDPGWTAVKNIPSWIYCCSVLSPGPAGWKSVEDIVFKVFIGVTVVCLGRFYK